MNQQELFWKNEYAKSYIEKNQEFDKEKGIEAWKKMLRQAKGVTSILECGCNIGRNIEFLEQVLPAAEKSIIEISDPAFKIVTGKYKIKNAFHGTILESKFKDNFDLVFTIGVLIHIHPDHIVENMRKIFQHSKKYILLGEYFNRTPVSVEYQGQKDRLFKRDFGKLFLENFNVSLVNYGFLWGHVYDQAGFDDITWWLFAKNGEK